MNLLANTFTAVPIPGYRAAADFGLFTPGAADSKGYLPRTLPLREKMPSAQFAVALAHEVRNPLNNINLSVEMLDVSVTDPDLRIYLDIIMRSSARINELIKKLLITQQAEDVRMENTSLQQLLDEVIGMATDRLSLKHITVRKEYATEGFEAMLDKSNMKIALTNIIINAIDAMETGKGELTLVAKPQNNGYIIEIADNGCGISKENLKHIFNAFFTNKPGGLGIGLSASYDILRANQVGVVVESEEGSGTRFMLLFGKRK